MSAPKRKLAAVPAARPVDYSATAAEMSHALHTENVEGAGRDARNVTALALLCEIETLSDAFWHMGAAGAEGADHTIVALAWMIRRRAEAANALLGESGTVNRE